MNNNILELEDLEDQDYLIFSLDELLADDTLSENLIDLLKEIKNKKYKNNAESFNSSVKYVSSKDDKSEAVKLLAASARTRDIFKSVKSAMGEVGFKAVVQYVSSKDDKSEAVKLLAASARTSRDNFKSVMSAMGDDKKNGFEAVVKFLASSDSLKAISLIKSVAKNKENFDDIKEIFGKDYFHNCPFISVKSILKSVSSKSFITFKAVISTFNDSQYTDAFKDESLQKRHASNFKKIEEDRKKRRNTSPSSDRKRRCSELTRKEPIALNDDNDGLQERSESPEEQMALCDTTEANKCNEDPDLNNHWKNLTASRATDSFRIRNIPDDSTVFGRS